MNFPLQYNPPPPYNINHPPRQKRKSTQSPDCNKGVAQTLYKVLHDVQVVIIRKIIVSVTKYLQKCLVNTFLMCFGQETLKPAL